MSGGVDCTVGSSGCDGPGTYRCDEFVWGSSCRAWQQRNGGYDAPEGVETAPPSPAEKLAQVFHETYELIAPTFAYATREASAKPWRQVPVRNRRLMIATTQHLIGTGQVEVPR